MDPIPPVTDPGTSDDVSAPDAPFGDAVRTGDVAPFAKRKCRTCNGSGQFVAISKDGNRAGKICHCALSRFIKNRRGDVAVDSKGQLMWKPGTEPAGRAFAPEVKP